MGIKSFTPLWFTIPSLKKKTTLAFLNSDGIVGLPFEIRKDTAFPAVFYGLKGSIAHVVLCSSNTNSMLPPYPIRSRRVFTQMNITYTLIPITRNVSVHKNLNGIATAISKGSFRP